MVQIVALVTGGAGFIGSHLVRRLLKLGRGVRVVDDLSTGHVDRLAPVAHEIDFVRADLSEADLRPLLADVDEVFHLAAVPSVPRSVADPLTSHTSNATATLRLLIAISERPVPIVLSSSSSVYGEAEAVTKREDQPTRPISPYAIAKLAAEGYGQVFARLAQTPLVILRYFNVFGPGQDPDSAYAAVIPRFIRAALAGRPLTIYGDGRQTRDFTYVDNVVDANLVAIAKATTDGHVYNIAAGAPKSLLDLVRELESDLGHPLEVVHGPARPGDIQHSAADIGLAKSDLGWEPRIDFEEGLRRTLADFRRG